MRTLVLAAAILALSSPAHAWRSRVYPATWSPGMRDAEGRFLHDFSYAGYHAGEVEPPRDPVSIDATAHGADPSGATDSTAAIQAALDAAADAGGGVVLLPAGTYRVSVPDGATFALWIRGDHTVLRGEGSERTRIVCTTTRMRGRRVIWAAPRPDYFTWYWDQSDARSLSADARATDLVIHADPSGYSVGDTIVVTADATDAWIAEHGMTGTWTAADTGGPIVLRAITAIDGDAITLDAPLRHDLRTRDGSHIAHLPAPLREVGIESLAIGHLQNRTPGTGDSDHSRAGTGAHEMHDSFWIYLDHVEDAWIRDVRSFRPTENSSDVHLLSNAIRVDFSRCVTIDQVHLARPQYRGEGGNGYLFTLTGDEILLRDSSAALGRHNVSFSFLHSSGNVVLRTRVSDGRLPVDFHQRLASASLLDGVIVERDAIELAFRDCCGHGHGTTESVVWNVEGLAYESDLFGTGFVVDTQQWGHGYVIGSRGAAPRIRVRGGDGTEPLDLVEGQGMGDTLEPRSLYEDQLARRLGRPPPGPDAGSIDRDAGTPSPIDAAIAPGDDASVPPIDTPITPDAGRRRPVEPPGGCAIGGARPTPLAALVLALLVLRRRSRLA